MAHDTMYISVKDLSMRHYFLKEADVTFDGFISSSRFDKVNSIISLRLRGQESPVTNGASHHVDAMMAVNMDNYTMFLDMRKLKLNSLVRIAGKVMAAKDGVATVELNSIELLRGRV